LHRDEWADYLRWAVVPSSYGGLGWRTETQIHPMLLRVCSHHQAIATLDADVVSSRPRGPTWTVRRLPLPLLAISAGVCGIPSPRVPPADKSPGGCAGAQSLRPEQAGQSDCVKPATARSDRRGCRHGRGREALRATLTRRSWGKRVQQLSLASGCATAAKTTRSPSTACGWLNCQHSRASSAFRTSDVPTKRGRKRGHH
jgi:hypothetical protein